MLYKIWSRFLTWFGDIYFATEPPAVKAIHIRKLMDLVQPGDIICRRYIYYLDSHFIKGKYSHSGVCVDGHFMVHSIAEGVGRIDVIDFVKDCDGFIVIRPSGIDVAKMTEFAQSQIGKPYDFMFDNRKKDAFYCHELTYYSLQAGNMTFQPASKIIYADDLISHCQTVLEV